MQRKKYLEVPLRDQASSITLEYCLASDLIMSVILPWAIQLLVTGQQRKLGGQLGYVQTLDG